MIVLRHFGKPLPFRTYFEELLTHHIFNFFDFFSVSLLDVSKYPEFQEAGSRLWNFITYPYLFLQFDGVLLCLLFLAGIASAGLQRRYEDRLLLVWFVVPFFRFMVSPIQAATRSRRRLGAGPRSTVPWSPPLIDTRDPLWRLRPTRRGRRLCAAMPLARSGTASTQPARLEAPRG